MELKRSAGFFGVSLLFSVAGLSVVSRPCLEAAQVPVVVDGAKIYAAVQGAELREVLKALADKTGLRVVLRGSPSRTVALRWKGISLEDAVHDLLRNQDYVLLYESTSGGPVLSEVWVFGDGDQRLTEFGREKAAPAQGPDGDTRSERVAALEGPVTPAGYEFARLVADLQRTGDVARLMELLRERIRDPDSKMRMFALSALIQSQDPRATAILADVVREDPDQLRRRIAANGLSQRGGAESVAVLAQALREDPDPQVRRTFLRILARMGEAALPAVSQATSDRDPGVAGTAQRILRRLTGTR